MAQVAQPTVWPARQHRLPDPLTQVIVEGYECEELDPPSPDPPPAEEGEEGEGAGAGAGADAGDPPALAADPAAAAAAAAAAATAAGGGGGGDSQEPSEQPQFDDDIPAMLAAPPQDMDTFLADGRGAVRFAGGHSYEGHMHDGRMHGEGEYTWASGVVYRGTFVHNRIEGVGAYTWPDGSSYEGGVQAGLRHGDGVFRCAPGGGEGEVAAGACGSWYEGQWERGQRSGTGILFYDEKKTSWYKGGWRANMRHGRGTMRYPSGNMYEGGWVANRKAGAGTMVWKHAHERYRGAWLADAPHGFGEYFWYLLHGEAKGDKPAPTLSAEETLNASLRPGEIRSTQRQLCNQYKGGFSGGLREGIGKFFYADGAVYEGEWEGGQKHGNGTLTFADGSLYEGDFDRDKMTGPRGRRPGEEEKRANPKEIRLCVKDLTAPLAAAADAAAAEELLATTGVRMHAAQRLKVRRGVTRSELDAVNSSVLQHVSRVKDIYKLYSSISAGDVAGMFTMNTAELLHLCQDCRLPPEQLSPAVVGRLLAAMRREHTAAVASARAAREQRETLRGSGGGGSGGDGGAEAAAPAVEGGEVKTGVIAPPAAPAEDVHDPSRPLLFREFVEALVRLAHARYERPDGEPEADEDAGDGAGGDGGGDGGGSAEYGNAAAAAAAGAAGANAAAASDLGATLNTERTGTAASASSTRAMAASQTGGALGQAKLLPAAEKVVVEAPGTALAARLERLWEEHIEPFAMKVRLPACLLASTRPL